MTRIDCWEPKPASSVAAIPQPILAKRSQAGQRFAILLPIRCRLAGDDVVNVADGKAFDLDVATPRILEPFDAVGCEDQVNVKRAVFELDEILAAQDFGRLLVRERKAQFA